MRPLPIACPLFEFTKKLQLYCFGSPVLGSRKTTPLLRNFEKLNIWAIELEMPSKEP
jgi:hypothetical protein